MTTVEIRDKIVKQFIRKRPNTKTIQEYFDALEKECGQLRFLQIGTLLYHVRITAGISFMPIYNSYPNYTDIQTNVKVKKIEIWKGEKMAKYRPYGLGVYVELEEIKEGGEQ